MCAGGQYVKGLSQTLRISQYYICNKRIRLSQQLHQIDSLATERTHMLLPDYTPASNTEVVKSKMSNIKSYRISIIYILTCVHKIVVR